jgi:UDP-glucuronate 4-epimerase
MLLVTGHLGFVGGHLTKELNQRNIPWVGYDLKEGNDIRDKYRLDDFFEKNQITEVIHLAALVGVRKSKKYPKEYIETNILGTRNIVDLCEDYKIKKLIFYSSSSVYGPQDQLPVKEDAIKKPISLYGITKLAGEMLVGNFSGSSVIIRPFTVYGENGRKDEVVGKWIEQIKNNLPITVFDEESCRGYVYAKDLVKSTVDLLFKDLGAKCVDLNLGGSEVIYLKDILGVFKNFYGERLKILKLERPGEDVFRQYTDISKAREMIGFNPAPNFLNNLRRILEEEKI